MAEKSPLVGTPTNPGVAVGIADISADALRELTPESFARNGVILCNERVKVRVLHGDIPVGYVLSLYVARDPMDETEAAKVAAVADERKAASEAKTAAEQAKRDREIKAAVTMTRDALVDGLRSSAAVIPALSNLAAVFTPMQQGSK